MALCFFENIISPTLQHVQLLHCLTKKTKVIKYKSPLVSYYIIQVTHKQDVHAIPQRQKAVYCEIQTIYHLISAWSVIY